MASNINPYNIDGTFPVAGQDNSSQGFRDNFTNTKNNFLFAQNEINDLQSKVLVTSALTGQSVNNDMAGTQLRRPQLAAWTQTIYDNGNISSSVLLDFNVANFQKITTSGSLTIGFSNWPSTTGTGAVGYGIMRVWINVQSATHTVTLPSSVDKYDGLAGFNPVTKTVTFDQAGNYVFEFSSIDGGNTFFVFDSTRNRSTLHDSNLYFNPAVTNSPTLFVGYGHNTNGGLTALNAAIAGDQGQNIVSSLGSYNSVSIGNLATAGTSTANIDTGKIAGYTITSARGNLALGTVSAVKSNDYLGYINAVSYSGYAGTSNVFQQMSSIAFYATGSNVTYGLGGNIAFFTSQDGEVDQHGVIQGLGIENDQSVKVFGNLTAVGTATIGGATSITGNATITGNAAITGTASIGGNTVINGGLTTNGGRVDQGTYVFQVALTGASTITANTATSTIILDNLSGGVITYANIILPTNPADRQTIKITTTLGVTNSNVWAPGGAAVRFVPSNALSSGNTALSLTYVSSNSTWYRS